jgi:hypothetical protein
MTLKHQWEHVPIYIRNCSDGNERQERVCQRPGCGLIRVTVIPPVSPPPYPWRRWRWPDGEEFTSDGTPECRGAAGKPVEVREAS